MKKNGRRGGGRRRRSLAMATSSAMRLLGSAGTGFGQGWETRKIKTYVTATLCDRGNTAAALYLLVAVDFVDPTAAVPNVT